MIRKNDSENYNIKRNIVTLGSAGLSSTQERYSAGEQECLAVLHAIQKTNHYVRGAPEKKNRCLDLEDRFVPSVSSKSLRTLQISDNPKDHHVETIARIAQSDNDYKYMVKAIKDKIETKSIKEDSELKKIEGQFESLSLYKTREGKVIVRDAQEILIPKEYKEEMLKELHSTHLSDSSMLNLAKGRLYWPGLREKLKQLYKSCEYCLHNAFSKPTPSYEVIPSRLHILQPNELVHLDGT